MSPSAIKVLCVDDEETDAEIARRLLEGRLESLEFRHALDGPAASEAVPDFGPDVVLLDYKLRAENGLDILSKLLKIDHTLPVVMLTGLGGGEIAMEGVRRGAVEFVDKNDLTADRLTRAVVRAISVAAYENRLRVAAHADEALRSSRNGVLDNISIPVAFLDSDGRVVDSNKAARERSWTEGTEFHGVVHATDCPGGADCTVLDVLNGRREDASGSSSQTSEGEQLTFKTVHDRGAVFGFIALIEAEA